MENTLKVERFDSTKILAYVSIGFFSTILLINTLYVFWGICNFIFPNWQLNGNAFMEGFTSLIGVLEIFGGFVSFAAIVVFLIWLYKAFSNLSALQAKHLEYTPGWAVGWWFVPLANLVKPYQVVAELWRESDPDYDESLDFLSSHVGNPRFFVGWWTCWIISNILTYIANVLLGKISTSSSTDEATVNVFFAFFILSSAFTVAAGGLLIYIIQDITVRQEKRFRRIGDSSQELPPEPPIFNE